MEEHKPYQERLKREPDFIVSYEIKPCEEMKSAKPGQGMRLDFLYEGDDPATDGVHMIWPEILDEDGKIIKDTTPGNIPQKGTANMWVVDEERRHIHAKRLIVGLKGQWVRGPFKLAEVTVTKIGSLQKC